MKINIKNSTFILLVITIILSVMTILLPSKNKISDVEVKRMEIKEENLVKIKLFYIDNSGKIEEQILELKSDSENNILKRTITTLIEKYSLKIELTNLYYGENLLYVELTNINIPDNLLEAIRLTVKEYIGIENVKLIQK